MDPLSQRSKEDGAPGNPPELPRNTPPAYVGMGALIGLGAAFGLIIGMLLDNLILGMIAGVAIGTVIGAVVESNRRRPGPGV